MVEYSRFSTCQKECGHAQQKRFLASTPLEQALNLPLPTGVARLEGLDEVELTIEAGAPRTVGFLLPFPRTGLEVELLPLKSFTL